MTQKKKILFCITKGNFGGAQKYVYDLATTLSANGFETVVALGNRDGQLLSEKLKEKNITVIEIEGLGRDVRAVSDFRAFKSLIKIIKRENPAVVHLNSTKIGLLGSLAVLYLKITTRNSHPVPHCVFTVHGWAFNEKQKPVWFRAALGLAQYISVLLCDTTIAVSEKTKRDAHLFFFLKNKIRVIHNGIAQFEILDKEEARIMLAGQEKEKIILFSMSELHHNKGLDIALRAISLLSAQTREKIIYCIAGDGEEKENLKNLASELNIEKVVKFLGFVPDAKRLLSGADMFLMPSRTEAFPYAILEAGLAGLPIIATGVGGIREVMHDMQNGILVHSRNPREIAEAIVYMLSHPDRQKEFSKNIKETVSNSFSLEKMVQETMKVYELT